MTFCSRRVAGFFFSVRRFASACVPPSFSSPFTLLLGVLSARRRANVQYTVILARARGCDRLLSTLHADATGQKQNYKYRRGASSEQFIPAGRAKMQRRAFLRRAGAGMAATRIASPGSGQAAAPGRWRFARSVPDGLGALEAR